MKFEFKEFNDETGPNGRKYIIDDERYPSVTTFLSKTKSEKDKAGLAKWRNSVGAKKADEISEYARNRGTVLHGVFEDHFKNKQPDLITVPENIIKMYKECRINLTRITDIWAMENVLYSKKMKLAGRVDCIGLWDGLPAIIDFKTSTKSKKPEWIGDYRLQTTLYSIMFYEMFGIKIDKYVIFIATESIGPQIFQGKPTEHIFDLQKRLNQFESFR